MYKIICLPRANPLHLLSVPSFSSPEAKMARASSLPKFRAIPEVALVSKMAAETAAETVVSPSDTAQFSQSPPVDG